MSRGEREEAERWAGIISEAYAAKAGPKFTPALRIGLRGMLRDTLESLLFIAVPPSDWTTDFDDPGGPIEDYPNPRIREWERQIGLPPGPRIATIDPNAGTVAMSAPGKR